MTRGRAGAVSSAGGAAVVASCYGVCTHGSGARLRRRSPNATHGLNGRPTRAVRQSALLAPGLRQRVTAAMHFQARQPSERMDAGARSKEVEQRGSRARPALHPLEHAALLTAAEHDGSHCDARSRWWG